MNKELDTLAKKHLKERQTMQKKHITDVEKLAKGKEYETFRIIIMYKICAKNYIR